MKNLIALIFLLSFCQLGCGQKAPESSKASSNEEAPITASNQEKITAQNYIQKEIKFIKPSTGTEYYFSIRSNQCFYEILVNDVPVYRRFEESSVITPVCLNSYINQSGKQLLTYRLYPQHSAAIGEEFKHLTENTYIKIELVGRKETDRITAFKNQQVVLKHTSATKTDGKTFIEAGKDYYEYTVPFEAEVPYTLSTLADSEDLSKLDQKLLLKKTEEAYRYYWNLIKGKKMDDYFRLGFKSDVDEIVSSYVHQEDLEAIEDADKFYFLIPEFKLKPLENHRMRLYGNGKIVCLEQTSEDAKLKNRSPIWGEAQLSGGELSTKFYKLYLHIPKGKSTFEILYKNTRFTGFDD
ncbi:hypothetical protein [Pedobacter nototheniae]|uniref:hypothetical protein n=1 Tax=Pedobacter nototheniae TaxID=2488994 RepID=UPI00292E087B|nr:hypothetical protein [Pedobacter nototheniae]